MEDIENTIQGTKIAGIGGLSLSYFLAPDEPSVYLTGGIGYSSRSFPFVKGYKAAYGFGIVAGIGYEVVKHFGIEGNITWENPRKKESTWYHHGDIEYKYNTLTFSLSLHLLGY